MRIPTSVAFVLLATLFIIIALVGMIHNMWEGCDWVLPLATAAGCIVFSIRSFIDGD